MGFSLKKIGKFLVNPALAIGTSGLLGGGGGKMPSSMTTTATNAPWAPMQPYLLDYMSAAKNWYGGGAPMTAGIPPELEAALQRQTAQAQMGSPLVGAAQNAAMDILSGRSAQQAFNPLYDYAAQRLGQSFQNITMPSIAARFSMGGRTGSPAEGFAYGGAAQGLGDALSGLASNIYGQERGLQAQTMAQLPMLQQLPYGDINQLMQAGLMRRDIQQQMLQEPLTKLQAYGNLMQPGLGYGQSTQTQPLYQNKGAGLLGGVLSGGALGMQMGGPMGGLVGAGLGGLLGSGRLG